MNKYNIRKGQYYYQNGNLMYNGAFKDGKFNGEGNITCNFGGFEGETGYFYIQGNWKNGKLDGIVSEFYDFSKKKSVYYYKEGQRYGICTLWFKKLYAHKA